MNARRNKDEEEFTSSSIFSLFKKIKDKKRIKIILVSLSLIVLLSITVFSIVFFVKNHKKQNTPVGREYLLKNIEMSRYQATIEYIISCFDNENGGFTRKPIREFLDNNSTIEEPDIWSTWLGFGTLADLEETEKINTTLLVNWIEIKLNDNPDLYGPEDLWGVFEVLEYLNETERIPQQNWINMIMNNHINEGGFKSHKDGVAPVSSTFFAYNLLRELNELDQVNWTKATEYVLNWQTLSGYFSHPLIPGGENIGETVYAYSFLNISKQAHLINETRLNEIINESFDWNYNLAFRISIAYALLDFALINGMSFFSQFIKNEDMIQEIKQSQQNLYGNFPFEWKDETLGDIYDTCRVITIFSENSKLDLLAENITIIHPPLSPYIEINETGSKIIAYLLSFILGLQTINILIKRRKEGI